jgi:hypothetical protein
MPRSSNASTELATARALIRFGLRLVILIFFAAFGAPGFFRTMAELLALATFYCVAVATWRREPMLGATLGHWDEAAVYTLIGMLLLRAV